MVLKAIRRHVSDPRGKFRPNWGGPYLIKRILSGGAAYIADLDGMEFATPVNIDKLRKYYPERCSLGRKPQGWADLSKN
ncbi:hypothetical protein RHMOL_Rhmol05G0167100 [Rhododendron molle]|uniref:Uncharacterized protein n=1 Tax=Rhododendron molle TaxID=49168 RepID=A0ACC0NPP7_RHOML|nr:hypothetical protein RHMOL_Rhmol05G0167100 [Rhododendron molle]